ncbi:hypothetical protein GCM10007049_06470 [Echinicola pacifica]|uniref:Ferric oxidoreductase domain-containing protein n=1 Tax=Echinicola pacifica TaxID=346377 RepID=A0A918PPH6_9BACT|nr:ferric reductase-like transmembrane domain-containing protein [Echinicola pacifica]GGZ16795.1 hypothetical protein GCM10007049_06470 [Echinicola pacifica]
MHFIRRNYGWIIVTILAILPLFIIIKMISELPGELMQVPLDEAGEESRSSVAMLYHISGEFAIRWMTAVLTCTPFFILFGSNNLFVRQAMGIATAVWSILHLIIFIWAEGFLETFTQVNYIAGFVAVVILVPLLLTSNRKSMKRLKSKWKKLQSLAYIAAALSLFHIILIEKTWLIYGIIIGLGFIIRIPAIKDKIIGFRTRNKHQKVS